MATIWVKIPDVARPYIQWSTIVDGPTLPALTQVEFEALREAEIREAQRTLSRCPEVQRLREALIHAQWDQRQRELDEHGTTSARKGDHGYEFQPPAQVLYINHCGKNGTVLTYQQFVDWYCSEEPSDPPVGMPPSEYFEG